MKSINIAFAAVLALGASASFADGHNPTLHPGHVGYVKAGGNNDSAGGVPTSHYHDRSNGGAPTPLLDTNSGPGGWGEAVSGAAKSARGIPNAHGS
jgi:hypothetical protein